MIYYIFSDSLVRKSRDIEMVEDDEIQDERLKNIDSNMVKLITNEVNTYFIAIIIK